MPVPRIAVIGLGKFGQHHLRHYADLSKEGRCSLDFAVDTDPDKSALVDQYGVPFREDAFGLDVDAGVIATSGSHYDLAKHYLSRGKHVFVEKPSAPTFRQAQELSDLAGENGLVLNGGYLWRQMPALQKLREEVKGFSSLNRIQAYNHNDRPPRQDSGALINLGIHPLDAVLYVVDKKPIAVSATANRFTESTGFEEDPKVTITYDNGTVAQISAMCRTERKKYLAIESSQGSVGVNFQTQSLISRRDGDISNTINIPNEQKDLIRAEAECFLDAIRDGNRDNLGKENPLNIKICEAALRSIEKDGEVIDL